MAYLPPESLCLDDMVSLGEQEGLSLLYAEGDDFKFLIFAGWAVFIRGPHAGRAFKIEQTNTGTWKGIVLRGLRIELDMESLSSDRPAKSALVIERSKTDLLISTRVGNGGMIEPRGLKVQSSLPPSLAYLRTYFTRWRLVMDVNGEPLTIEDIDVTLNDD